MIEYAHAHSQAWQNFEAKLPHQREFDYFETKSRKPPLALAHNC